MTSMTELVDPRSCTATSSCAGERLVGFPPNRGGFLYAASGWMAAIFSYSTGGSKPAVLCRRRRL
jgi:hypothetical protein